MLRSRAQCFEIPSHHIALHFHRRFLEFLRATVRDITKPKASQPKAKAKR